jgi:hypothetical protein
MKTGAEGFRSYLSPDELWEKTFAVQTNGGKSLLLFL